jgi:TolA-binding protein
MRGFFLLSLLMFGAAAPVAAQPNLDRRVGRLEQEMRAVQRRVFPGGIGATVDPELQPTIPTLQQNGATGDAISNLASRIEAVEAQLARVTGQVEENGYRVRQLEEQMRQLNTDLQARIARLEQAGTPPVQAQPQAGPEPEAGPGPAGADVPPEQAAPTTSPGAGTGARPLDAAQAAYNEGFRLWEQGRFADAAAALTAVAQRHPSSRWASWSRNLAGRAHLDDNKPAMAARVFLENYQANPRGERAADSLFFLGEALVKLNRRSEACPVYDELQATYPNMRAFLRERLPAARQAARCS